MSFDDVFAADIGAVIAVSNGKPRPALDTLAWKMWFSHNFSGALLEKTAATDDAPRSVRIQAIDEPNVSVSYTVTDDGEHTFEVSP